MSNRIRALAAAGAIAVGAAVTLVGGVPAGATGAVGGGVLLMHGPGSVYAAPNAYITAVTTAGGTATYTAEVVNRGTQLAQFNVRFNQFGAQTATLTSGSTNITTVAEATRGYFTKLLAPGKTEVLTLKMKMPASASQTTRASGSLTLYTTDSAYLDSTFFETEIKATTGPYATDLYTSTAGSAALIAEESVFSSDVGSEPIKPGGKATYTVKAQNDSQTPLQLRIALFEFVPCDGSTPVFPVSIKVGTADVTPAVVDGTYMTPVLAHGKSTTFTVVVSYPPTPPTSCAWDQVTMTSTNNQSASDTNLTVNLAG